MEEFIFLKVFLDTSRIKCSLEDDILPKLIKSKKIQVNISKIFLLILAQKNFLKLQIQSLKEFHKPAAFLDRDGVINIDYGYVHNIKRFKLRNGVIKGLQYLIKKNYYIFIITNQAGIGKKIYSENDFIKLHKNINEKFKKNNIFIDDVQFSPFHVKAKIKRYKKNSSLRKPGNKMIENIKNNWDLNLKNSFMIGDKKSDYEAAKKSKLKFYYPEKNFYKQIKSITNNY